MNIDEQEKTMTEVSTLKMRTRRWSPLMEEVGELAKVIRKRVGMKFTDSTEQQNIREKLADVQIVLLGLASMLEEYIFKAVVDKEKKNQARTWK